MGAIAAVVQPGDQSSEPALQAVTRPLLVTQRRRIGFVRILLYALSTGDFNVIHFFNRSARRIGFARRFTHGGLIQGVAKDLLRRNETGSSSGGVPMITKENW